MPIEFPLSPEKLELLRHQSGHSVTSASLTTRIRGIVVRKVAAKQTWVGEIEAADEREAFEKAAKEFKQHATKLIAVRRQ